MLATGVLILTGAVAMTKFRRVYEAAILKTLGASTRTVGSLLLLEYGSWACWRDCGVAGRRRAQLRDQPLGH